MSNEVGELKYMIDRLIAEADTQSLTTSKRKALEKELRSALATIGGLLETLDPISQPTSLFDPSNPKIVGRFVSLALVAQQRTTLANIPKTYGSGVYAIYYNGPFPAYLPISRTETPIYVGQAAPATGSARTPREQGPKLSNRLSEHRKNIDKAKTTLGLNDFEFRWLAVQSGWEKAAEDYLIHLFRPIWNNETKLVFGLGKHGDSAQTRQNKRSPWDTLHPGRTWAAQSSDDAKTIPQIERELNAHFENHPAFQSISALLASFLEELRQV